MATGGQREAPMVHLVCAVLFSVLVAVPATAQTGTRPDSWRIQEVGGSATETPLPAIEVGSYARLGLGMFGPKAEPVRNRAVTVREITAPRHRRAGVGFSMKF